MNTHRRRGRVRVFYPIAGRRTTITGLIVGPSAFTSAKDLSRGQRAANGNFAAVDKEGFALPNQRAGTLPCTGRV